MAPDTMDLMTKRLARRVGIILVATFVVTAVAAFASIRQEIGRASCRERV